MTIEAYILCWNESETIHLTIKHYQKFCSKIIILDNYSDDNSPEIARAMGCEVKNFGIKGILSDEQYRHTKNTIWEGSQADWVIICDADEILYHKSISEVLQKAKNEGRTIFKTFGWNVFSHSMPLDDWSDIRIGKFDGNYCKSVIFDPKSIRHINYSLGAHVSAPRGTISYAEDILTLFHYRNMGGPDRLVKRHESYRPRMSEDNVKRGLGCHYLFSNEQRVKEWYEHFENCKEYSDGLVTDDLIPRHAGGKA